MGVQKELMEGGYEIRRCLFGFDRRNQEHIMPFVVGRDS